MVGLMLWSCAHDHSHDDGHGGDHHDHGHEEDGHSDELTLTKRQMETIGLEFGGVLNMKINDFVKTTGTLGLPPNAYASVSPRIDGIIKGNKKYVEGEKIRRGEVVAYVQNPILIEKQQAFMEAQARLKQAELDLDRQRELINADAGVSKFLQEAEAEVAVFSSKAMALAKELKYYGIAAEAVSADNIEDAIAIVCPMSGYISKIDLHEGMYVQPQHSVMSILQDDHLHLELDVFEKDIAKVQVGQKISYSLPALGNQEYIGEVSVMGREFDRTSKTIRVHGHLEGEKPNFVKDLFVNAKIWINDETVDALPEDALIHNGSDSFIYVAVDDRDQLEIEFTRIDVIAGVTEDGFTSVKFIDEIPSGMSVVTKGAYFVYAQSMAGELEHEH